MKKILKSNGSRFLGSSSLHRKFREARTTNRGKDSFYRSRSLGYSLI